MKKQYIEYGAGCGGLKRVIALYEDGVLVKRIDFWMDEQSDVIKQYEKLGYEYAFRSSEVEAKNKEYEYAKERELIHQ